jgi:hypothetical protein
MWRRNSQSSPPTPSQRPLRWANVALTASIVLAVGVVVVLGLRMLERRTVRSPGTDNRLTEAQIQINRHWWMPQELARSIAWSLRPPTQMSIDREHLAQEVYDRALSHPMVRSVEPVRLQRTSNPRKDLVVVKAAFRRPVARVAGPQGYAYVDGEGVRLPVDMIPAWVRPGRDGKDEYFLNVGGRRPTPDCRAIHYILINGVASPVPAVGHKWEGQDLADGIRLVELISSHPWANQVTSVDVRNHGRAVGTDEAQIAMVAQRGQSKVTTIRFGRFPLDEEASYMVPTDRKLAYLDEYAQRHDGSIAGLNDWLDLRYDRLHASLE